MQRRFAPIFLAIFASMFFSLSAKAQAGACPPNLDFENGDFLNWECRIGTLDQATGNINWSLSTTPVPNRHSMLTTGTAGRDQYGNFQQLNPNTGGLYSVMLGNTNSPPGKQVSEVSYTYTIPANATVFSMIFWYAVVLFDPGSGHASWERPRFKARIINVTDNISLPCVDFDFIAASGIPGFRNSTLNPNVIYKDWTPITLNLSALAGKTIRLEFQTLDCTRGGHFGYAYVDVSSMCNGVISGNYVCPNTPDLTMTAPYGFQSYTWYADNTFSTIIGNQQTLNLNPAPAVGTVIPVIVEPYPGFGCRDTLYATIDIATPPPANAGPDKIICNGQSVQIGSPPLPGFNYSWTPSAYVSNPTIADPIATPPDSNPLEYIVEMKDLVTNCLSKDTVVVSTESVDKTSQFIGPREVCFGEPGPTLNVSNSVTGVQWMEVNTGPIPGQTGMSFSPIISGTYYAVVTQGSCIDSTNKELYTVHPLPVASFTMGRDTGCVKISNFNFTNTSSSPDNASMTYVWTFSDGVTETVTDATRTFNNVGLYDVHLMATTEFGCKDISGNQVFRVMPQGKPNFSFDSICTGRPVSFRNLSQENGSVKVNYVWDFNNGGPLVNVKDPLPVVYNNTPGKYDVTLKMTTLGCEIDTQKVIHTVQVNRQAPGIKYHDFVVPAATTKFIHARDTVGSFYNWRPKINLSHYDSRYTEVNTNDDVTYYIDIADNHTCVTTDTLNVLVLKKPGFYLPSGFTPNGDGLNDVVRPYLVGMKGLSSFSVFNRWGNLIYYTEKYGDGWDGKSQNVLQASGVYIWVLRFYDATNTLVTEKGTISLIR